MEFLNWGFWDATQSDKFFSWEGNKPCELSFELLQFVGV
jgi:hypothetical protein